MICFGLCLTLSAWLLLPETAKDVKGRKSYSFGAIIASYGTVLKNASYRKSMTILVSAYLGVFAFTSSSPYIMQTLLGLSPLQYGMTQITTSIGYMAGNLVGARFSHRITQRSMIRIGSGIMVVAISTQAIVYSFMPHSAFALIAFQAIMLFGNGLLVPQIIAAAVTPFPDRAGAATSLLGFTQMAVAAIIGTFLANMLGQTAWPVIVTGLVTVSIIVAKIYVWPGDKPDVK
jgi:DHA1 family bicyclomycin/chloramphenicol resistance-like MFS transporter